MPRIYSFTLDYVLLLRTAFALHWLVTRLNYVYVVVYARLPVEPRILPFSLGTAGGGFGCYGLDLDVVDYAFGYTLPHALR